MSKYIVGSILLIVGISIGMGLYHYYPHFNFKEKIDIVEFASLIVTAFLAIYIPAFLERHMQNKRNEKDVIIRKIEGLQAIIKTVNQTVSECFQKEKVSEEESYQLINLFTKISNELDTVITLTEHCDNKKFKANFEEIKDYRFHYRKIVTGGDFQNRGFKYFSLDKKEEEKVYQGFDKALCVLIFEINKI